MAVKVKRCKDDVDGATQKMFWKKSLNENKRTQALSIDDIDLLLIQTLCVSHRTQDLKVNLHHMPEAQATPGEPQCTLIKPLNDQRQVTDHPRELASARI